MQVVVPTQDQQEKPSKKDILKVSTNFHSFFMETPSWFDYISLPFL